MNSDKEPASSESTRIRIEPHKPINTHSAYDLHQPSRLQWNNSPPRDRSDFEIAIICALPLEASVVSELFDRRYDEKAYGKAQGDSNAYSTGVIGNHNVVLVHMPDMGKVAAATAAACLHSSFQNIQLALTVGICGAAPFDPQSGKDIHIGDVVISEGLIQYDLGRQYPNNTFMRKDTPRDNLPRPRPKVRAVLATLKTKQGLYWLQNQLSEHLKAFPQKLSETAPHPGAIEDELFTNGSVTNPTTHFGLIASGDTVMKSAEDRDFIISRDGVIAFEMEGAGASATTPTAIKNKKWQDYAATTAAAVTKAFLEHWSTALKLIDVLITDTPRAPSSDARARESEEERTRRAKEIEILKMLYRSPYLDQKDRNLDRISGTCEWFVSHRLFKEWQEKKSTRTLWISADPGCGKSVLAKYLIDHVLPSTDLRTTCYFFFKDDFEDQRSIIIALCCILHQLFTQKPALLSKAIFERFQATGEEFARSFRELWDALLCATDENAGEIVCVLDAIDECEDGGRARLSQALRELYSTSTKRCSNLKFLLTSRPYGEIRRGFRPLDLPGLPIIHLSGESDDEMKKISLEIDIFIKARVRNIGRQLRLRDDEEDLLLHELMRVPNRTYLWVRLTLDLVESDVNIDKSKIVKITSNLPTTVDEAYERILSKSRNLEEAKKLLQIVVAAERPLTLEEMNLAMALALRDGHQSYDDVDLKPAERFREEIRDLCGLIVTIVDSKIYLLHQTVKEFLVPAVNRSGDTENLIQMKNHYKWKHSLRPLDSHSVLATICLQHLQFAEFGLDPQDDLLTPSKDAKGYVFLDYSAKNWFTHIHESQAGLEDTKTQWVRDRTKSILKLCDANTRRCQTWFTLYWMSTNMVFPTNFDTFLIVSYFGFTTAIGYLPESAGPGVNRRDDTYLRTALSWAAGNGFTHTVDRLISINNTWWGAIISERVDINAIDKHGRTPLVYAVWNRHISIVELLLNAGARVDIEDDVGGTPLSYAICSGNDDLAKLLLKNGAEAESKESIVRTLLFASVKKGDRDVVELLFETNIADPNVKDREGRTLLLWATVHNHKAVINSLVKAGARLDYKDVDRYILLYRAVWEGNESAVEGLFEAGFRLYPDSAQPQRRWERLILEYFGSIEILGFQRNDVGVRWTVNQNFKEIVNILKNSTRPCYDIMRWWPLAPLSLAIENGNAAIVRLLLDQKVTTNSHYNLTFFPKINIHSPRLYRTPLSRAAEKGDEAIVELLLEYGAKPDLEDRSGGTPLSRAANTTIRNIIRADYDFDRFCRGQPDRI
ncbi:hypothetical protein TWF106_006851 [Orbilia oligospora]|uniref:NACHT domain-containing protein n=1 Tax=Orbilia oligospora TaxID=2813651 RepID=A0A7C8QRL6_ORBOL|nr:hypothetical protein TWF106_006851 [Orbilia oligospora]